MENKKAEAIWTKLLKNRNFNDLVDKYREDYSIPLDGFENEKDYLYWLKMVIKDKKLDLRITQSWQAIYNFIENFNANGLENIVIDYLHLGSIEKSVLSSANTTGCDFLITDKQNIEQKRQELEAGYIYIKVSPTSRHTDIKLFLHNRRIFIKAIQNILIKENKIDNKVTKFKPSKYTVRDYWVCALNDLDIKIINELSGLDKDPKDIKIAKIMRGKGYKMSADNVRKIIQRGRDHVTNKGNP